MLFSTWSMLENGATREAICGSLRNGQLVLRGLDETEVSQPRLRTLTSNVEIGRVDLDHVVGVKEEIVDLPPVRHECINPLPPTADTTVRRFGTARTTVATRRSHPSPARIPRRSHDVKQHTTSQGAVRRLRDAASRHRARDLPAASYRRLVKSLNSRLDLHDESPRGRYRDLLDTDPHAAVYLANFQTARVRMPVENLRWSRLGLALTPELNPFVCAIVDSRSSGTSGYEGSSIDEYYTRWQPASVAELLGLSVDSSPELRQPAAAVGLPWMPETENVDPANRLAVVDRWAREESLRHGRQLDSSHGHKLFGPASDELGRLEYQRYCDLAASIAHNGYEESLSEPIGVQLLIDDCNWVGLSTGQDSTVWQHLPHSESTPFRWRSTSAPRWFIGATSTPGQACAAACTTRGRRYACSIESWRASLRQVCRPSRRRAALVWNRDERSG